MAHTTQRLSSVPMRSRAGSTGAIASMPAPSGACILTCQATHMHYAFVQSYHPAVMCYRSTCVLFGDGAGAAVLKRADDGQASGILGYEMHSNGAGRPDLNCAYAGSTRELPRCTHACTNAFSRGGTPASAHTLFWPCAMLLCPLANASNMGRAAQHCYRDDWRI